MLLRPVISIACSLLIAVTTFAQPNGDRPSPTETATASLTSGSIKVSYGAPSIRGRKIMGELVPFGKVWRTGANEATTFATNTNLKIGGTAVPAGTYTLYTLPGESQWLLIVSKQTGQWGTEYNQAQDLARIPMKVTKLPSPQEKMSISFENTKGNSADMHVRWENTDASVGITAQ